MSEKWSPRCNIFFGRFSHKKHRKADSCNLFLLMEFYMLTGINQSMKTGMKNRRPKGMIQGQEQLSKLRNKNQVVITTKKTCFNHIKLLVCQSNTLLVNMRSRLSKNQEKIGPVVSKATGNEKRSIAGLKSFLILFRWAPVGACHPS